MKIGIAAPIEVSSLKLHLTNLSDFDLSLGLGGTAVNIIIDGLLKQGHQVVVFTLDKSVKKEYTLEGENLKIIFGRFRTSARIKSLDFCFIECIQIYRFVKREVKDLDVINAHWSYEFAIGTLLVAPNKTIVTFRDDAFTILRLLKHPYRFTRLLMDRWVRNTAKYKIFNSHYLFHLIKSNGTIIPNPIFQKNITSHRSYPQLPHVFKICFIANGTDSRKNPHIAVAAFQELQQKIENVELYFFGKGFESDSTFAKSCSSIENIFFKGFVNHNSLLKLLNSYDIMLHTSLEESFGNNLVEGMATGIPVLAGQDSGAVPWVLDNGKAGVLVDITSAEEVAIALEQLILNSDEYEKYSKAGYNNVITRFTQEIVCKKYIKVYQRVINESTSYFE